VIIKYFVAVAVALGSVAPAFAQTVNAGIEAWQHGNYSGAVGIWRPLADHGDADAQFNLGQAYRLGRGVTTNLALARSWLEKAASQGHVDAETTLGLLLFQNGDQAAGLKWLKLAAEASEPRAMLVYGTALFNGDSVTQDPIGGYAYVYRAYASGLPAAKEVMDQLNKLMNAADKQKALALVETQDKAAGRALFAANRPPKAADARKSKPAKTPPPKKPAAKPIEVAKAEVPKTPPATETTTAKPVKTAPKPASAKTETASTGPASGGWRIQVGAFGDRASAEAAYRKLAGNAALAGRGPQYIPFQKFIRLRIGPFASKTSAAAACSAVRVACYPVAPGK
jgi:cell division septation protein DedD